MKAQTLLRTQLDRVAAVITAVAGGVVLILGWYGVSGTAYATEQLPFIISGGIGGLFLLGVSSVLWLSADLSDEWRKLDRIERAIRAAGANDERVGDTRPSPRGMNDAGLAPTLSPAVARNQ